MATGVLPLLIGRATRLAQFMSQAGKTYEAGVRFGWATDTYDATGEATGPRVEVRLDEALLTSALASFRGPMLQRPPAFSAKKVDGTRAYRLARRDQPPALASVPVTVHALELLGIEGDTARLRLECSAGFYVRSLAHDLGVALGTGAHLAALRRTRSGEFDLSRAVPFADVTHEPDAVLARVIAPGSLLRHLPGCRLTREGLGWVLHGRDVEPRWMVDPPPVARGGTVRLLDAAGNLVALGVTADSGALHPAVVLR
jgi:tRNA pseudouridine55 synthase